ncbi:hypothetical protein [Arthrobacter sp. Rue61a]|uniref:endonuclease domain-containing protein n=1 Tax=Arthrobacter sp. Rue61a TaxID=1118963 RepID=UPI00027DF39F|nr:hypothetical protein [Arthrobacter sp. Rue61a]AFR30698.1 hypothetical protein ARUE_c38190 [Arthrobacter sp. Rue61a]
MRITAPLPIELQGRSFTLAEQQAAGLPDHRAWNSDLRVASRGIRVPWGKEQDPVHTARLLTAVSGGAVCCRETAAMLWGCPLPWDAQHDFLVHLTRADGTFRPQRRGVRGHRMVLMDSDVSAIDGIPVTTPARTWLDLAGVLPFEDLVAAADHFICSQTRSFGHNRVPLCSVDDLKAQVERHAGARGIRKARAALDLARVGADSVPETRLRLAIGRDSLPEPVLSYVVCDPAGRELVWPDLAFPDFKVAINYDGGHHLSAAQKESDIRREASLAANGWISVVITVEQVRECGYDGVVRRIREALIRGGWSPRG